MSSPVFSLVVGPYVMWDGIAVAGVGLGPGGANWMQGHASEGRSQTWAVVLLDQKRVQLELWDWNSFHCYNHHVFASPALGHSIRPSPVGEREKDE